MTNGFLGTIGFIKSHEIIKGTVDDTWSPGNTSYEITDYIQDDSMILWADGIYNEGIDKAHNSSAATWVDLSNNKNGTYNGTISRRKWEDNCAVFSGQDDGYEFVSLPLGQWTPTFELVFSVSELTDESQLILNNREGGGGGFYITTSGYIVFTLYINGAYQSIYPSDILVDLNKIYSVSSTYDGQNYKFYCNGQLKATKVLSGPATNGYITPLTIGRDSRRSSSSAHSNYFNGRVFEARVYNRVLTDDEILHNYRVDKYRFM